MGCLGSKTAKDDSAYVKKEPEKEEDEPLVKDLKAKLTEEYTLDELKELNKSKDKLYIVLFDTLVLNVANFKDKHPGGDDILEDLREEPASGYEDFLSVMHSNSAMEELKDYAVGLLVEKKSTPDAGEKSRPPEVEEKEEETPGKEETEQERDGDNAKETAEKNTKEKDEESPKEVHDVEK